MYPLVLHCSHPERPRKCPCGSAPHKLPTAPVLVWGSFLAGAAEQWNKILGHSTTWGWGRPRCCPPAQPSPLVQTPPNQLFPTTLVHVYGQRRRQGGEKKKKISKKTPPKKDKKVNRPFHLRSYEAGQQPASNPAAAGAGRALERRPQPLPLLLARTPSSLSLSRIQVLSTPLLPRPLGWEHLPADRTLRTGRHPTCWAWEEPRQRRRQANWGGCLPFLCTCCSSRFHFHASDFQVYTWAGKKGTSGSPQSPTKRYTGFLYLKDVNTRITQGQVPLFIFVLSSVITMP